MSVYKFYDSDDLGWDEYDICGDDYVQLLKTCFRYCTTFSMYVKTDTNSINIPEGIEKYRIPVEEYVKKAYPHYVMAQTEFETAKADYEIRHYSLCPEVQNALLCFTDSIFKWVYGWGHLNPDDPAFFRFDGSIFFSSVIHEGECTLYPREYEDISKIVCGNKWSLVK